MRATGDPSKGLFYEDGPCKHLIMELYVGPIFQYMTLLEPTRIVIALTRIGIYLSGALINSNTDPYLKHRCLPIAFVSHSFFQSSFKLEINSVLLHQQFEPEAESIFILLKLRLVDNPQLDSQVSKKLM